MFKRIRQLRISLAAKCQILFGAAVVLIICLRFVGAVAADGAVDRAVERPAASALADNAVAEHIALHSAGLPDVPTRTAPPPPAGPSDHGRRPYRRPRRRRRRCAGGRDSVGRGRRRRFPPLRLPHLVSLAPRTRTRTRRDSSGGPSPTSPGTPTASTYFAYYDRPDGTKGYRYAQPLYLNPKPASPATPPSRQPDRNAVARRRHVPLGHPSTAPADDAPRDRPCDAPRRPAA